MEINLPFCTKEVIDIHNLVITLQKNGNTPFYRYNSSGQRIYKDSSAGKEHYLMNGSELIAVWKEGAGLQYWQTSYGRYQPNNGTYTSYYYVKDHLGSTRVVLNEGGQRVEATDYYAFDMKMGGRSYYQGTKDGYTTKERDSETGWDYFGARYYNPAIARWNGVDALSGTNPSVNPYNFVLNNPISLIDPDGFKELQCTQVVMHGSGAPYMSCPTVTNPEDWTSEDRIHNRGSWITANNYNLSRGKSGEYKTIEQRAAFYKWFQNKAESMGYGIRWAGAASMIASGMRFMSDQFDNHGLASAIGSTSEEVNNFARVGNAMIFNNVFGKLKNVLEGPVLTGEAAKQWDAKTLSEEQNLIQPLYKNLSPQALQMINDGAKQKGFFATIAPYVFVGQIPPLAFPANGDITKVNQRWAYGMNAMGRQEQVSASAMPRAHISYTNGSQFNRYYRRP